MIKPARLAFLVAVVALLGIVYGTVVDSGSKRLAVSQANTLPVKPPPFAKAFVIGPSVGFMRTTLDHLVIKGEVFSPRLPGCGTRSMIIKVGSQPAYLQIMDLGSPIAKRAGVSVLLDLRSLYSVTLVLDVPQNVDRVSWTYGSSIIDQESGKHGFVPFATSLKTINGATAISQVNFNGVSIRVPLRGVLPSLFSGTCG